MTNRILESAKGVGGNIEDGKIDSCRCCWSLYLLNAFPSLVSNGHGFDSELIYGSAVHLV